MKFKKQYYITPSLYSSIEYLRKVEDLEVSDFFKKVVSLLKKEEMPPTPAMLTGIAFEKVISDIIKTGKFNKEQENLDLLTTRDLEISHEIAKIVGGGIEQKKLAVDYNNDYVLYGVADWVKQNKVYDIKRVSRYEEGKYYNSIQHLIYLLATGLTDFDYLISDGKEFYVESYNYKDKDAILNELKPRIESLLDLINGYEEFKIPFQENFEWGKEWKGK